MILKQTEPLKTGLKGFASLIVEEEHTASHVGSGSEQVLATPVLIALMEAAAVDCVEHHLDAGQTSLGTHVSVDHKMPSPLGHSLKATAELIEIGGRRLKFKVLVEDKSHIIGEGVHLRTVVETEEFRKKNRLPSLNPAKKRKPLGKRCWSFKLCEKVGTIGERATQPCAFPLQQVLRCLALLPSREY